MLTKMAQVCLRERWTDNAPVPVLKQNKNKNELQAQYSFTCQTQYIAKTYMHYKNKNKQDLGNTVASKIVTNFI